MLIDWFTVAAQAINFVILVWLLQHFLYKPVLAAIDSRETKLAAELQAATMAKAQAQSDRDALQLQTETTRRQSAEVLRKAAVDNATHRQQLLDAAVKDSQALRLKLNEAVSAEREQLNQEILNRIRAEVFAITRKVLADVGGAQLEDRIVDVFIQRLHDLKPSAAIGADRLATSGPALLRSAFELNSVQRVRVEAEIAKWLPAGEQLRFATAPELIGGVELTAGGRRISWNMMDYLASLAANVNALLDPIVAPPAQAPPDPVQHAA
jgi:F-type H+-transporting ATPase subunit b